MSPDHTSIFFYLFIYLFIRGAPFSNQWLLAGKETFCCVHQETEDACKILTKAYPAELVCYDHIANILGVFSFKTKHFSHWKIRMEPKMPKKLIVTIACTEALAGFHGTWKVLVTGFHFYVISMIQTWKTLVTSPIHKLKCSKSNSVRD